MSVNAHGSIRRLLLLQLLLGAAVLAVALFFIVQSLARQTAQTSQDNILVAAATAILDASTVQQGELQLDLPYSAFSMLSTLSNDRVFYAIHADQTFLSGYDDLPPIDEATVLGARFESRTFRSVDVRVVTAVRKLALLEGPVAVRVTLAQSRDSQLELLNRILRTAAAVGSGFFATVALLAILAARSSIGPILRLTESVGRRGPQDLSPVRAPVPHEMAPLVAALNGFMDRLKTSLGRSEDFIAEAAHRVRTPLATVRTQAEITLRRVDKEDNRASLREMIRAIDESSRAAGQMLDHAMVTFRADHLEQDSINLTALAQDMVERLKPIAEMRDVELRLIATDTAQMIGDTILVQSALRNLLDNAIKYSAPEGLVTLTVAKNAGQNHLKVLDQGIGFPPEGADHLTKRFTRGSNVEGVVGSGIGLTIAQEVATAHGGRLHITNNNEGPGACVTLSFPL